MNYTDKYQYSSSRVMAQNSPRPGFPQRVVNSGPSSDEHHPHVKLTGSSTLGVEGNPKQNEEESKDNSSPSTFYSGNLSTIARPGDEIEEFSVPTSTFDYLYEFSETRKVLEEFFKCPTFELDDDVEKLAEKLSESDVESLDIHYEFRGMDVKNEVKKSSPLNLNHSNENLTFTSPSNAMYLDNYDETANEIDGEEANEADVEDEPDLDYEEHLPRVQNRHNSDRCSNERESNASESPELNMNRPETNNGSGSNKNALGNSNSRYFRYSPETTDYDSNCGDLDSLSGDFSNAPATVSQINYQSSTYMRQYYTSMPVLEDGLSSGHVSDTENNNLNGNHPTQGSCVTKSNSIHTVETNNRNNVCNDCPGNLSNNKSIEGNDNSSYNPPSPTTSTPTTQTTVTSVRISNSTPNHFLPTESNYFPSINTSVSGLGVVSNKIDMIDLGYTGNNHMVVNPSDNTGVISPNNNLMSPLNSDVDSSAQHGFGHILRDENLNPIPTNILSKKNISNVNSSIFRSTDPDLESYSISKFNQNGKMRFESIQDLSNTTNCSRNYPNDTSSACSSSAPKAIHGAGGS